MSWRQLWWSLLHVTVLNLKPQKSLSFSPAANLKYQFDVINEGQCVWKTSTMHGLFKTASINHIFITKRLIILFLWKSREHVYHFLSCIRFIKSGSQRRQTCAHIWTRWRGHSLFCLLILFWISFLTPHCGVLTSIQAAAERSSRQWPSCWWRSGARWSWSSARRRPRRPWRRTNPTAPCPPLGTGSRENN